MREVAVAMVFELFPAAGGLEDSAFDLVLASPPRVKRAASTNPRVDASGHVGVEEHKLNASYGFAPQLGLGWKPRLKVLVVQPRRPNEARRASFLNTGAGCAAHPCRSVRFMSRRSARCRPFRLISQARKATGSALPP